MEDIHLGDSVEELVKKANSYTDELSELIKLKLTAMGIVEGAKLTLKDNSTIRIIGGATVFNLNNEFYVTMDAHARQEGGLVEVHTFNENTLGNIVKVEAPNKSYFYKFYFKTIPPIAVKGNIFMGTYGPKGPTPFAKEDEVIILPKTADEKWKHRVQFEEGDYVGLLNGVTLTEPITEIIKINPID